MMESLQDTGDAKQCGELFVLPDNRYYSYLFFWVDGIAAGLLGDFPECGKHALCGTVGLQ